MRLAIHAETREGSSQERHGNSSSYATWWNLGELNISGKSQPFFLTFAKSGAQLGVFEGSKDQDAIYAGSTPVTRSIEHSLGRNALVAVLPIRNMGLTNT